MRLALLAVVIKTYILQYVHTVMMYSLWYYLFIWYDGMAIDTNRNNPL